MRQKTILLIDQGVAFGGSLIVLSRLAQSLDAARFRPVIVSAMDWSTIRDHVPAHIVAYQIKPRLSYVERSQFIARGDRILPKPVLKASIYLFSLAQTIANIPGMLKLFWIIFKENAALLHINNWGGALLAAKLTGRPALWHFHGVAGDKRWLTDFYQSLPEHFLSISHYVTRSAVAQGLSESRITTIHNPVAPGHRSMSDEARRQFRSALGFSSEQLVIGIFGRVIEWKGQLEFLKAMKIVVARNPLVRTMIVGDGSEGYGDYPSLVRDFAERNFPSGQIVFTGYQSDVDSYYQASDIVVHASIAPEPFGLVITEAMQNGRPVIGATTGAVPELIEDGLDGLLADPRVPEQLAEKILFLAGNPDLRNRLSARALDKVALHFDPAIYARKVGELYERVLARSESR